MKAVHVITGTAVPLRRSDVDTDQIIPAEWLKRVERTGFGAGLFSSWRDDRAFVLNDERHAGATVLVAGANFGIGSSREHAVWALQDYGFDAVVSSRFSDIFFNNCTKNGLLPVVLEPDEVVRLHDAIEADPTLEVTIDVERLVVEAPAIGFVAQFPIDPATQHRFLEGLDDIGITLASADDITAFEATRPTWLEVEVAAAE
jgi:3-isopropylmalate/(R)-2-methylmalate dehydratase small subunit